jgi:hypothetical protein
MADYEAQNESLVRVLRQERTATTQRKFSWQRGVQRNVQMETQHFIVCFCNAASTRSLVIFRIM